MTERRAAIYTRVAFFDNGPEQNALEQQIAQVREHSLRCGYKVTHVYQDLGSGLNAERPGLQQMITDARAGVFDVVVMRDPARLFRNWKLFQHYYALLREELGIEVIFTTQADRADHAAM